jgi:hypothetical protein
MHWSNALVKYRRGSGEPAGAIPPANRWPNALVKATGQTSRSHAPVKVGGTCGRDPPPRRRTSPRASMTNQWPNAQVKAAGQTSRSGAPAKAGPAGVVPPAGVVRVDVEVVDHAAVDGAARERLRVLRKEGGGGCALMKAEPKTGLGLAREKRNAGRTLVESRPRAAARWRPYRPCPRSNPGLAAPSLWPRSNPGHGEAPRPRRIGGRCALCRMDGCAARRRQNRRKVGNATSWALAKRLPRPLRPRQKL